MTSHRTERRHTHTTPQMDSQDYQRQAIGRSNVDVQRFAKQTPVTAGECKGHWQVDPRWQLTAVMHGTPHVELGVIEVLVMSRRAGETKLNLVSESTMSNSIERSTKGNPDNYPASSLQFPDVTRRLVLS